MREVLTRAEMLKGDYLLNLSVSRSRLTGRIIAVAPPISSIVVPRLKASAVIPYIIGAATVPISLVV